MPARTTVTVYQGSITRVHIVLFARSSHRPHRYRRGFAVPPIWGVPAVGASQGPGTGSVSDVGRFDSAAIILSKGVENSANCLLESTLDHHDST